MKVAERLIEKEGALQGERVGMTIDTDALSHIMSVLTDLYSDPEAAVIREYSTNALDSHIEAGQTRPIEVTTPTPLMPFLKIRDYGVGLDADGIREIYSRYGTSTKRQSDDVVGMLGLGCKSALTYCDQFTLVGVKDGTMTTVAVGRDEDGSGTMTIVDTGPTTEPNGLEVVIPAKRENLLRAKAEAFFGWWAPGTVLLNGEAPRQHDITMWVEQDRIGLTNESSTHGVVMGNVFYPLSDDQAQGLVKLPSGTYAVFFVGIGEVNFTPSREALQSTRRTRETLAALIEELTTRYHESLAAEVATAKTHVEAVQAWYRVHNLGLPLNKALWRGAPVEPTIKRTPDAPPGTYRSAEDDKTSILVARRIPNGYRGSRKSGDRTWEVRVVDSGSVYNSRSYRYEDTVHDTVVFEGFDGKDFTEVKRQKVEAFLNLANSPDTKNQRWLCFDKLTADERRALHGWPIHQWADVEAIKLTGPRAGKKVAGSYPGTRPDGKGGLEHVKEIPADEIPTDKVLWVKGSWWSATPREVERMGLPRDHYFIALSENRITKFKRDFPKAKNLRDWTLERAKSEWEALDPEARLAGVLATRRETPEWLTKVANDVSDPRVTRLAALHIHSKRTAAKAAAVAYGNAFGEYPPTEFKEVTSLLESVNKSYPLLSSRYIQTPKEHIILYINAVMAAEGKAS